MAERGARHALHLLDGGTLTLTHQMVFLKGGFEQFTIPVPYFLVRHPDGNVLVDGGMQIEACVDPGAYLGEELVAVMRPRVGPDNHVLAQLELLGVEPESIRYVIQTHLHFDHAGAIGHLPQATFLVHRRELAYAGSPDWFVDAYNPRDFVRPGVRWQELELAEDETPLDLYGDGAVNLIFTPGHSPGLLSVLLRLDGGAYILAGDAADTLAHYDNRAMPGLYVDGAAVVRSVARLRRVERDAAVGLVVFGHDLEQWHTLRHGRDSYT